MHWSRFLAAFLTAASLLSSTAQAGEAEGLSRAEFEKLLREVQSPREPWQSIPWNLSLLDARSQAAKEKKPIYMLCRSGHPLGCV